MLPAQLWRGGGAIQYILQACEQPICQLADWQAIQREPENTWAMEQFARITKYVQYGVYYRASIIRTVAAGVR